MKGAGRFLNPKDTSIAIMKQDNVGNGFKYGAVSFLTFEQLVFGGPLIGNIHSGTNQPCWLSRSIF